MKTVTDSRQNRQNNALARCRREAQRHLVSKTLLQTSGNVSLAARLLRVDRANLHRLAKKLGIPRGFGRPSTVVQRTQAL